VAVRGVYSAAEEAMLAATEALFDTLVGFDDTRGRLVATEESMVNMARAADPWNLLWRKEEYARRTRWKDIIGHPMFLDRLSGGGIGEMPASPECGYQHLVFVGEDWKFFHPVRKGDVFRVFRRRPEIVDVTSDDGEGPRTFGLMEVNKDYVNQDEKVVAQVRAFTQRTFLPGVPQSPSISEYAYSMEELRYIAKTIGQEHVRGAAPRYWEDVNLGDRILPTVLGPTSMVDNVMSFTATPDFLMEVTPREWLVMALDKNIAEEFVPVPATGLFQQRGGPAGHHWSNRAAQAEGEPLAFLFAKLSRLLMCRCVTNWMGDDGWLAAYRWRHAMRTPVGDTLVARGQVTGKRDQGAAHLVDLSIWIENMRGMITEVAQATVVLRSKVEHEGRTT
jgi:acyl dehydratase